MDPNQKLKTKRGETIYDLERYKRIIGKLRYLTVTFC